MKQFSDDDAIGYGFVMVALFFLAAALLWLALSVNANMLITEILNPRIIAGTASKQTANTVSLLLTIWRYVPPAIFLGGFVWSIRRAVYVREGGQ